MGEAESVRSSRSRGISTSRDSGITLDRIYDHKHFPTRSDSQDRLSSNPNSNNRSSHSGQTGEGQALSRTLLSYKSL
jgi:hypothetical protein